jgi:ArsR family transcriptional regulator
MNDKKVKTAGPRRGKVRAAADSGAADEELAAFAKALAHPARIQILRLLASRSACVCGDIVKELPLAQSTVSEHLRILKAAGLILGTVSGPKVCYCIDKAALVRCKSLVEGIPVPLDSLDPARCKEV